MAGFGRLWPGSRLLAERAGLHRLCRLLWARSRLTPAYSRLLQAGSGLHRLKAGSLKEQLAAPSYTEAASFKEQLAAPSYSSSQLAGCVLLQGAACCSVPLPRSNLLLRPPSRRRAPPPSSFKAQLAVPSSFKEELVPPSYSEEQLAAPSPLCDAGSYAAGSLPAGSGTFMLFRAGFSRRPPALHYINNNIILYSRRHLY